MKTILTLILAAGLCTGAQAQNETPKPGDALKSSGFSAAVKDQEVPEVKSVKLEEIPTRSSMARDYYAQPPVKQVLYTAMDSGFEEHVFGHGIHKTEEEACTSCLKKHGNCRFEGYIQSERCDARFTGSSESTGYGSTGYSTQSQYGSTYGSQSDSYNTFQGESRPDRRSAEESALFRCMMANWGNCSSGRCVINTCGLDKMVVESGTCKKTTTP